MTQKWPHKWSPNGSQNWHKSRKIDLGSLWGRSPCRTRKKFQKYIGLGAPGTSNIELSLQRELNFQFPRGTQKMTKTDPQKWPLGPPFGSLWDPMWLKMPSRRTFQKMIKKSFKKWPPQVLFLENGPPISLNFGTGPHLDPHFAIWHQKWRFGSQKWSKKCQKWHLDSPSLTTRA